MSLLILLQSALLLGGAFFFLVGTVGLLRLPDAFTRIHALTKVDNLGLGLIVLGLLPSAPSLVVGAKFVLIWLLTLAASAIAGHLVANAKYHRQQESDPGNSRGAEPARAPTETGGAATRGRR